MMRNKTLEINKKRNYSVIYSIVLQYRWKVWESRLRNYEAIGREEGMDCRIESYVENSCRKIIGYKDDCGIYMVGGSGVSPGIMTFSLCGRAMIQPRAFSSFSESALPSSVMSPACTSTSPLDGCPARSLL